jgi:uncharacterized cupin superfamily protein
MQPTSTVFHPAASSAQTATPDAQKNLDVFGLRVDVLIGGQSTGGAFSAYEVRAEPGQGPLPHVHEREDESFYVLEGEFEILQGDATSVATAGSIVFLPRGVAHTFRNVGATTGRLLGIGAPSGHEKFFEDMASLSRSNGATPDGPPDMEAAFAICRRHGIELVLPANAA